MNEDTVNIKAREITLLEAERTRVLARLDAEERAAIEAGKMDHAEAKRLRWLEVNGTYDRLLDKQQAELAGMRQTLATLRATQERKDQESAAQVERATKARSRKNYPGTDSEFEKAWPGIWAELRQRRAVNGAERQQTAPVVHL